MKKSSTPSDNLKPVSSDATSELIFPDWSGATRNHPRVGWEAMHRLSEELLRSPWHRQQARTTPSNFPPFEL